MVQIPKVVGVLSCGFLLSVGLSVWAQAQDMKTDQSEGRGEQVDQKRVHYVRGSVVRVEYGGYVVKQKDGTEVILTTDNRTQIMGQIKKGDRIEAKVNDKNHALLISPLN
jgi:hypothetical protein